MHVITPTVMVAAHADNARCVYTYVCVRIGAQDSEKREEELRNRLKQQQQRYEAVSADRNNYSKGLIEAQDEIAEMKRKFKIMTHQVCVA